jgi:protein gp37
MHPDWVRSLRDQCATAGAPFFFKQWGEWQHGSTLGKQPKLDAAVLNDGTIIRPASRENMEQEDRRQSVMPRRPEMMASVGKARAGRVLDGKTHDDYPENH